MHRKLILLAAALVLVLIAGAACAPQGNKVEFSSEQVCKNLVLLNQSIDDLQNEQRYSDTKAVQAQAAVVRTNFNNLMGSIANLNLAEKDDFQKSVDNLLNAASALPEGTTPADAISQLKEPIAQVRQAGENLKTGLQCK